MRYFLVPSSVVRTRDTSCATRSFSSNPSRLRAPASLPPWPASRITTGKRSEEHTSELQSRLHLVCRLLLEKKKKTRPNAQRPRSHKKHNSITDLRARPPLSTRNE